MKSLSTQRDAGADGRRDIDLVAVSRRAAPPTYEELYGERRRQPDEAPAVARRRRSPVGFLAVAGLVALGMGTVAARAKIVAVAPPLARMFAAVGLPVDLRGLDLRRVHATVFDDNGRKTLGVEGEIVNLRDGRSAIPELRFGLRGADGREVYAWTSAAQASDVAPHGTMLFRARLASPPETAHDVLVTFTDGGGRGSSNRL